MYCEKCGRPLNPDGTCPNCGGSGYQTPMRAAAQNDIPLSPCAWFAPAAIILNRVLNFLSSLLQSSLASSPDNNSDFAFKSHDYFILGFFPFLTTLLFVGICFLLFFVAFNKHPSIKKGHITVALIPIPFILITEALATLTFNISISLNGNFGLTDATAGITNSVFRLLLWLIAALVSYLVTVRILKKIEN